MILNYSDRDIFRDCVDELGEGASQRNLRSWDAALCLKRLN